MWRARQRANVDHLLDRSRRHSHIHLLHHSLQRGRRAGYKVTQTRSQDNSGSHPRPARKKKGSRIQSSRSSSDCVKGCLASGREEASVILQLGSRCKETLRSQQQHTRLDHRGAGRFLQVETGGNISSKSLVSIATGPKPWICCRRSATFGSILCTRSA